jgi:hypothetical protein
VSSRPLPVYWNWTIPKRSCSHLLVCPAAGGLANAENPKAAANRHPNAKAQLLAALAEQYGPETAAAMIESMISMGIIDENGSRLTYRIEMDGEFYTLEQMRSIVTAPGADLSKEVKVDDQTVTLDFIAKLIDFEDYMQFVEDNFIKSQVNVTGEHLEMLADLEQQLNSEGINLVVDPDDSIVDEVYGSNPLKRSPRKCGSNVWPVYRLQHRFRWWSAQ